MHATGNITRDTDALAPFDMSAKLKQDYLVFRLAGREYGIDLKKVQELRGYDAVIHATGATNDIDGTVNLQGLRVPVVNLYARFGLSPSGYRKYTDVVILNSGGRIKAIAVDCVIDVVTLSPEQLTLTPAIGAAIDADYLIGVGTTGPRALVLVDIDKLIFNSEAEILEPLAA